VAYVVADGEAEGEVSGAGLREYVKARLPEYMVPTAFVELEEMPLTAHGKVDRRALLERASRPRIETAYVAPRTLIEEKLAGIWSEVLRVNRVGLHDNFFALGGQSLLAMQTVSRVRKVFQVELPIHSLFVTPTVEGLALAVLQSQVEQKDNPAAIINKIDPIDEGYLLTQLDELSEEEVDLFLDRMLTEVELDK
jgi:hypothetical protein